MPLVQRKEFGDKKRPLWVEVHTQLSVGQRKAIMRIAHDTDVQNDQLRIGDYQTKVIVLLCEAWNLPDPEKEGETLPKSEEGLDRALTKDNDALWKIVGASVDEAAYPNA